MDEVAGRTISPRCGYRALVALLARPQPQMASIRTECAGQKPGTTSRRAGSRSHTHFLGLRPKYREMGNGKYGIGAVPVGCAPQGGAHRAGVLVVRKHTLLVLMTLFRHLFSSFFPSPVSIIFFWIRRAASRAPRNPAGRGCDFRPTDGWRGTPAVRPRQCGSFSATG